MRVIITTLVFFLCTAIPVFSEIVVQTKDGRAIRVPVNANEVSRIDCKTAPVFSGIVVQTKDGRAIRVPVNVNEVSRIDFTTNRPTASSDLSPVGSWNNDNASIWTITATPDGGYYASEKGLGNAQGPAYFTESGAFRIDYTWSGGTGVYEVRFAPDYLSAKGFVNSPRDTIKWVRINP